MEGGYLKVRRIFIEETEDTRGKLEQAENKADSNGQYCFHWISGEGNLYFETTSESKDSTKSVKINKLFHLSDVLATQRLRKGGREFRVKVGKDQGGRENETWLFKASSSEDVHNWLVALSSKSKHVVSPYRSSSKTMKGGERQLVVVCSDTFAQNTCIETLRSFGVAAKTSKIHFNQHNRQTTITQNLSDCSALVLLLSSQSLYRPDILTIERAMSMKKKLILVPINFRSTVYSPTGTVSNNRTDRSESTVSYAKESDPELHVYPDQVNVKPSEADVILEINDEKLLADHYELQVLKLTEQYSNVERCANDFPAFSNQSKTNETAVIKDYAMLCRCTNNILKLAGLESLMRCSERNWRFSPPPIVSKYTSNIIHKAEYERILKHITNNSKTLNRIVLMKNNSTGAFEESLSIGDKSVGKSILALRVCYSKRVAHFFSGGIFWVDCPHLFNASMNTECESTLSTLSEIMEDIDGSDYSLQITDCQIGLKHLRNCLLKKDKLSSPALIVLDGLSSSLLLSLFILATYGTSSKVLVPTRYLSSNYIEECKEHMMRRFPSELSSVLSNNDSADNLLEQSFLDVNLTYGLSINNGIQEILKMHNLKEESELTNIMKKYEKLTLPSVSWIFLYASAKRHLKLENQDIHIFKQTKKAKVQAQIGKKTDIYSLKYLLEDILSCDNNVFPKLKDYFLSLSLFSGQSCWSIQDASMLWNANNTEAQMYLDLLVSCSLIRENGYSISGCMYSVPNYLLEVIQPIEVDTKFNEQFVENGLKYLAKWKHNQIYNDMVSDYVISFLPKHMIQLGREYQLIEKLLFNMDWIRSYISRNRGKNYWIAAKNLVHIYENLILQSKIGPNCKLALSWVAKALQLSVRKIEGDSNSIYEQLYNRLSTSSFSEFSSSKSPYAINESLGLNLFRDSASIDANIGENKPDTLGMEAFYDLVAQAGEKRFNSFQLNSRFPISPSNNCGLKQTFRLIDFQPYIVKYTETKDLGKVILAVDKNSLLVFDAFSGTLVRKQSYPDIIQCFDLDTETGTLFFGTLKGYITTRLSALSNSALSWDNENQSKVTCVRWGNGVCYFSTDESIISCWDGRPNGTLPASNKKSDFISMNTDGNVWSFEVYRDYVLIAVTLAGSVALYDFKSGSKSSIYENRYISAMCFDMDSKHLAVADSNGCVNVWKVDGITNEDFKLEPVITQKVNGLQPDILDEFTETQAIQNFTIVHSKYRSGHLILVGATCDACAGHTFRSSLHAFDLVSREYLGDLMEAVSPQGQFESFTIFQSIDARKEEGDIATLALGGSICIWDMDSLLDSIETTKFRNFKENENDSTFSEISNKITINETSLENVPAVDNTFAYSVSETETVSTVSKHQVVQAANITTETEMEFEELNTGTSVSCVTAVTVHLGAYSMIAVGLLDQFGIRCFDYGTGFLVQSFYGHTQKVNDISIIGFEEVFDSYNMPILISSSNDNTVRLWDIESGTQTHMFNVCATSFSWSFLQDNDSNTSSSAVRKLRLKANTIDMVLCVIGKNIESDKAKQNDEENRSVLFTSTISFKCKNGKALLKKRGDLKVTFDMKGTNIIAAAQISKFDFDVVRAEGKEVEPREANLATNKGKNAIVIVEDCMRVHWLQIRKSGPLTIFSNVLEKPPFAPSRYCLNSKLVSEEGKRRELSFYKMAWNEGKITKALVIGEPISGLIGIYQYNLRGKVHTSAIYWSIISGTSYPLTDSEQRSQKLEQYSMNTKNVYRNDDMSYMRSFKLGDANESQIRSNNEEASESKAHSNIIDISLYKNYVTVVKEDSTFLLFKLVRRNARYAPKLIHREVVVNEDPCHYTFSGITSLTMSQLNSNNEDCEGDLVIINGFESGRVAQLTYSL